MELKYPIADKDNGLFQILKHLVLEALLALGAMSRVERALHVFWLLGPAFLLIERTPADIWVSTIAIGFLVRSTIQRDFTWLKVFWVQSCFVFLGFCLISSALSLMPVYAFSESIAWFRFPVFAMATVFWLGRDKRLLYAMFLSTAFGMLLMTGILTAEFLIKGAVNGRLSWPYGDLVSGNYLAKVGLPAFAVMVALAVGARPKIALIAGILSFSSIVVSILAGERINFILRACVGMMAALCWRPKFRRYTFLILIEVLGVFIVLFSNPSMKTRFVDNFVEHIPTGIHSAYYRVFSAGLEAAKDHSVLGLGPATYRDLCPKLLGSQTILVCDNHPHNFYIQLYAETGMIGVFFGIVMIGSIIWAASAGLRENRDNILSATAVTIPFGLFFPLQSTGDFFGQWNNIFMWSAIALALAASRILISGKKH